MPPPFGGIAVLSKSILQAGLRKELSVIELDVGTKGVREKINSIRFIGAFNALINYFKLFFLCVRHLDSRYAFVTGTSNWGVLRDFGFVFILWMFRVKILLNLHGTRKLRSSNILIRSISILEMKMAYRVLSPTKVDYEAAEQFFVDKEKVHLFYNSAYIPQELTNHVNKRKNENDKKLTLIGIGRLSDAKGTYDLLDVCIKLIREGYNIHLKWIGRGAYEEDDLKANEIVKDEKLEEQIQFLKDLSEEEKYQHINNSDIFVLPTKNDNLPISILEAMACGKPIISSFMGAIPEVISEDNGWLINPGSKEKLAECIKSIYLENFDLEEIGKNNLNAFSNIFASKNRVKELLIFSNLNP